MRRLFFCLLLLHVTQPLADEATEKEKLQQLTLEIQTIQRGIQAASKEIRSLEADLEKTEKQLAVTRSKIASTRNNLATQQALLAELQQQKQALAKLRNEQSYAIATQVNLSYRIGREPTLKLLLNMENPVQLSRILRYHDYFLRARAHKLADYLATIEELTRVELQRNEALELLASQKLTLEQQLAQGEEQNRLRNVSLNTLNMSLKSDTQLLDKLQRERTRLETVLRQLQEALANIEIPSTFSPFSKHRGNLSWPVSGNLEKKYGQPRNSQMKWQGWLLSAKEGSEVRAVHHGRVVFADYLRGHGLLVVIDHGEGYMSLYAHNQILLAETGDWISSGKPIARVGVSGGQQTAGLYFEIRYKGQPTNPSSWLRRKG